MPTAARIAERAGYSVRSIFERFPDLNKLRAAAADYQLAQAAALAPPRNIDGDRQSRIKSQVETRAGTCERGVALWRVLIFSVDQDEELKPRIRTARERTIERMEIMYRPELSTLSERDRKQALQVDETFEDRPRRNPCTGGDLGGGRDLGLLAQQLDIGFHDQLLGALAAQAPTVKRR